MDRDLWKKLLDRAHERYEASLRWGGLLLAVLVLFHVAIFERYLSLSRSLASTDELRRSGEEQAESLRRLSDGLRRFQEKAAPKFTTHFDSLRDQLVADFRHLQFQLEVPPREAALAPPGPLGAPPSFPDIQRRLDPPALLPPSPIQMPLPRPGPPLPALGVSFPPFPPPVFSLTEADRAQLRAASGSERDLIEVARPIVSRYILEPRLRQLTDLWRREVLEPAMEEQQRLLGILAGARPPRVHDRELDALQSKIGEGVSEAMKGLTAVRFTAPEGAWWRTVGGKGAVATTGAAALTVEINRVEAALMRARPELEDVKRRVEGVVSAHATALADIERRLRDVQKEFNELQSRVGDLTKPLPWIPLPLDQAVSWFPLLLGLVLSAVTELVARRLSRLASIAGLAADRGDDADLLRVFYFGGVSGTARWLPTAAAVVGGVGLVWVAYAAWRLGALLGAGPGHVLGQALVGIACLVAATAHHAAVRRRANSVL